MPPAVDRRFPTEDGLIIDTASGRAWLARSLREEGFSVGRILAEIDISELLRVRKQVLLTLVAVNAGLALGFATIGSLALRRMLKPLSVLSGYVERVRAGRADPIPESKRRHISREFDLLFERFNAMALALNEHEELASRLANQEKYAVLGKLASGMAHEVNNPLGGLFNALDTLRRHGDDRQVREATLNLLERGLTHIRNVVRSTLVTYRREAGELFASCRRYRRSSIARRAGSLAKAGSIRLGQRPPRCGSGRRRKREASHTQSPDQRLRRDAGRAELSICERAPSKTRSRSKSATTAQDCPTILPNTSSDMPMKRPSVGGGLGLWIVRRLVADQGGEIRLVEEGGFSTLIRVTWPFRRNFSRLETTQDPVRVEAIHAG